MPSAKTINVYLEIGKTRTFAGALDWPGWCRSGRDEASALQALLAYAPRYARAVGVARLGFHAPKDISVLKVTERLTGNTTTDFGAPDTPPAGDARPLTAAELARQQKMLAAAWRAFEGATAADRPLRLGPRGGGRDVAHMLAHVLAAEAGYMNRLGWKQPASAASELDAGRQASLEGLAAAAAGQIPAIGPRGGKRWSGRFFVRRAAWHLLDHAWEIEDRAQAMPE